MAVSLNSLSQSSSIGPHCFPHCFLRMAQGEILRTTNKNRTTAPKYKRFCQHNTEEHRCVREYAICCCPGSGFCHNICSHTELCKGTWQSQSLPWEYQAQQDLQPQKVPRGCHKSFLSCWCTSEAQRWLALGVIKRGRYNYLHSALLKPLGWIMLHQHLLDHSGYKEASPSSAHTWTCTLQSCCAANKKVPPLHSWCAPNLDTTKQNEGNTHAFQV